MRMLRGFVDKTIEVQLGWVGQDMWRRDDDGTLGEGMEAKRLFSNSRTSTFRAPASRIFYGFSKVSANTERGSDGKK